MPAIKPIVTLESQEEDKLRDMLRKGTWRAVTLLRVRILLIAHDHPSLSNTKIGNRLGCHRETVRNVKQRYFKEGLERALFDKPRPGMPPKLDDKDKAYVVAKACTKAPDGYDHWTLALLVRELSHHRGKEVSDEAIRLILLENKLKPWQKKNVVHSRPYSGV